MRALVPLFVAFALGVQSPAQRPHGPYADREGWVCHQGDTVEKAKRVHCACKAPCENGGHEDHGCLTYCTSPKCLCHLDSSCDHAGMR